ncbi:outer membrane transport energization protein TonB [Paraburkholderia caballeronis]|uniref:Protein TonB n=1 Tax=Paraburkholderia caballeronis TaxID=416943 RepID=A0A1H7TEG4_9BURK|nr:outer membrane transport energization protein TonB [Paraburkholderia caballeronis]PXW95606.1 outer membrane transport energization protein TonB [Paraburkholderia caballeronis]RAJ91952.1 outer membrane transport energization protein TonB [Paraburkholderia caballeronis]TDV02943.1 outer membrane transport energization protein TonB [Paraburkholderia caballeronis]TDV06885.1 outer membrane transport energization protein TonB [Paraburkholderia caballeronis]
MDVSLPALHARASGPLRTDRWARAVAVTAAVLLHVGALVACLNVYTRIGQRSAAAPGSGLRVTLVAATPAPPAPVTPPAPQPVKRTPPPRRAPVLATRSPSPRTVAAPAPEPEVAPPSPVPVAATPPQPSAPAQPAAAAPQPPSLALPGADSIKDVGRVSCDIPRPVYPPRARRLGHEGSVVLRVTIDPAGRITQADVSRGSGFDELDAAAQRAIVAGRCEPYVDNGAAIAVHALQQLDFRLDD